MPFHLSPADLEEAKQSVTPKEEILEYLFTHSEELAARLHGEEYTTDKWKFNKYSMKALTMRYALYHQQYERYYLWPFHENRLRVEPGLVQNPGY